MSQSKIFFLNVSFTLLTALLFACSKPEQAQPFSPALTEEQGEFAELSYLALGDSYTIGESVSTESSFPLQLEKSLETDLNVQIQTKILAKTGWRTDDLLKALNSEDNLKSEYDFVTLLIGVNNQYQGSSFEKYEEEFPLLLARAIRFADNNPENVVVISIPDWGFTPFGSERDRFKISSEIDLYNTFAKTKAEDSGASFVEITDITREGLDKPEFVASDGLHPSADAYKLFVNRIAPIISASLKD